MCRSIKILRRENEAPDEEIRAASLQFVRKIAGYRKLSRINTEPFETAVDVTLPPKTVTVAKRVLRVK